MHGVLSTLTLAWCAPWCAQTGEAPDSFRPPEAIQRCCAVLLELQEGEGRREWPYEGVYRVPEKGAEGPVIPIGYRVGGTAIACLALLAADGYPEDKPRQEAVARGVDFVLEALDHPLMEAKRMSTYDVRGWGFVYALQLLVALEAQGRVPQGLEKRAGKAIEHLIEALEVSAIEKKGGWTYSGDVDAAPFMTAPALQALFAAAAGGHRVSKRVVEEALDALERSRAASGSIAYSAPPKSRAESVEDELGFMDKLPGSTGRMLAAETVLALAGRGDPARLSHAVRSFFTHWGELEVRRKQTGTHVEPYGIAPYYVLFAHEYAAQAIELLEDPAERERARGELCALLARIQEGEGGWNDRVFPRSRNFGTAMGILALTRPAAAPPARWAEGKGSGKTR